MKRPVYGKTLRILSASNGSGVEDFYNGKMAKNMVREIQRYNGIIDEQDFKDYRYNFCKIFKNIFSMREILFSSFTIILYFTKDILFPNFSVS